jgi:murein L,D-transpeptidase YcbB/YkuD
VAVKKAVPVLDTLLVTALKRFQARHGLAPNGVIDPATYAALTTPLQARVRQIELTLERWRWLPPFTTPPIVVNIPQFRLFAFRSTQDRKDDILQMDVIVGQAYPSKQTPVFAADMRYVIFRPYWEVPHTIVINELLPKIRKTPGYLAGEHLRIVQGDSDDNLTPLAPTPENLAALEAGTLRLRQEPGPDNSLGLIKFMLPNSHDVYLHSTPAHSLFKESRRAFSHGCIRVSDPADLAVQVLRDTPGDWTAEKVQAAMAEGDNQRVNLAHPIRVYILYATAMANEDGAALFFEDIYGHDRALETLLQLPPLPATPDSAATRS